MPDRPHVPQFLWSRTETPPEAAVGLGVVAACAAAITQLRSIRLLAGTAVLELGMQHLSMQHTRQQGLKLI